MPSILPRALYGLPHFVLLIDLFSYSVVATHERNRLFTSLLFQPLSGAESVSPPIQCFKFHHWGMWSRVSWEVGGRC